MAAATNYETHVRIRISMPVNTLTVPSSPPGDGRTVFAVRLESGPPLPAAWPERRFAGRTG